MELVIMCGGKDVCLCIAVAVAVAVPCRCKHERHLLADLAFIPRPIHF